MCEIVGHGSVSFLKLIGEIVPPDTESRVQNVLNELLSKWSILLLIILDPVQCWPGRMVAEHLYEFDQIFFGCPQVICLFAHLPEDIVDLVSPLVPPMHEFFNNGFPGCRSGFQEFISAPFGSFRQGRSLVWAFARFVHPAYSES